MAVRIVLFDVGGTLVWKPGVALRIAGILAARGSLVRADAVADHVHRLSEAMPAPATTTRDFYRRFNTALLGSLGVPADPALADEIYESCRGLPWTAFGDAPSVARLRVRVGIVSNWDLRLRALLARELPFEFDPIVVSAELGIAKPATAIFVEALRRAGVEPAEAVHVGDSIVLDVEPARAAGIRAILVDRAGRYPGFAGERIGSLEELPAMIAAPTDPLR